LNYEYLQNNKNKNFASQHAGVRVTVTKYRLLLPVLLIYFLSSPL